MEKAEVEKDWRFISKIWKGKEMTLHNLVSEITQFLSWLYYRREWATWELILMAVVALAILIILRGHRKAKARKAKAIEMEPEKRRRGR